jgi:nucleotide-binding universal stress UspA family protein
MKKIILPTDFSKNAFNAICYAAELFKKEECVFYLVNTYTPAIYQTEYLLQSPGQIGLGDIYQSESLDNLETLKKELEKKFKNTNHKFIVHSAFNMLVDEILEIVEKESADYVIMGTQGATGAKEIFLGTNTVHVIKKATCPVIAIPEGFKYKSIDKVVFPTDYEVEYTIPQLEGLLFLLEKNSAHLDIIHIRSEYPLTNKQESNRHRLGNIFETVSHQFHEIPNQEIITGIHTFQTKNRADMLAMIQNKHTFLERLFIEPIIKKIGFHIEVPFMVIP